MSPSQPQHRTLAFVVAAIAIVSGLAVFRAMKAAQERAEEFHRPAPSIEAVRTAVEHGTDPDVDHLDLRAKPLGLAELKALPRPIDLDKDRAAFATKRISPFETTIWTIRATITQATIRPDGDLYLVIEGPAFRSSVEVPDPVKCVTSPFHDQIARARGKLMEKIDPMQQKRLHLPVELTGIGFFGTAATGENGARLEPLLDLKWL